MQINVLLCFYAWFCFVLHNMYTVVVVLFIPLFPPLFPLTYIPSLSLVMAIISLIHKNIMKPEPTHVIHILGSLALE